ncbi:MAG: efflux transporter outer membrane subunit [Phycisphaeraceae bacterium]|nr:efflux transporter outer membrane subunit [Phycisphaeraceae bacterium]
MREIAWTNKWRQGRPATGLALGFALLTTAGCMVGPNFKTPEVITPSAWVGPTTMPATAPSASAEELLARWWTVFNDPTLSSLVDRAIQSNLDVRLAESRIRQARAARGVSAAAIGPTVNAAGSYRRSQASSGGSSRTPPVADQYQAGFDAGWELDFFGGARRGVEAANADIQAALEDRHGVLVTLAAEVARNYTDLRAFQQRAAIARRNLAAQQHSADLTRQRYEGGFVSGLDLANANALVASTAGQIPLLEASAQQTIYTLSILLGQPPGALLEELSPVADIPAAPPQVPTGVPSELLRRRPDIRQAEAQIHAATARIGVATADLFPKFTLTGAIGYQSGQISSWFNPASQSWSFGPSATWQIFDSGRIKSNIKVQNALEEQSILNYQKAVLTALQEVENALISSASEQEHRKALMDAVVANRIAVDLSTKLYTEGQTDFLNVLNAQRSLYSSEDSLAQSDSTVTTNLIALYKALGGGWESDAGPNHSH